MLLGDRDAFHEMLASVPLPFDECKKILQDSQLSSFCLPLCRADDNERIDITLDTGFADFYRWCKAHDLPFVVVSR